MVLGTAIIYYFEVDSLLGGQLGLVDHFADSSGERVILSTERNQLSFYGQDAQIEPKTARDERKVR